MKNKLWMIAFIAVILFLSAKPTIADLMTEQDQTIAVSEKLLNSTVKIDTADGTGSGFFIDKNTVLTAEHVVRFVNGKLTVTLYSGKECNGKVGYRDEGKDLAIVTVDCEGTPLSIAGSAKIGQSVIVAGNPRYFDFSVSKGIVSSIRNGYIQIDAHIDYGSSGGVAVNLQGQVVAVVAMKYKDSDYIGYGIPVRKIHLFLTDAGRD